MERYKDECEEYNKRLQLEVIRREEVRIKFNQITFFLYIEWPIEYRKIYTENLIIILGGSLANLIMDKIFFPLRQPSSQVVAPLLIFVC